MLLKNRISYCEMVQKLKPLLPSTLLNLLRFHFKDITFCYLHSLFQREADYREFLAEMEIEGGFKFDCKQSIVESPEANGFKIKFDLWNDTIIVTYFK